MQVRSSTIFEAVKWDGKDIAAIANLVCGALLTVSWSSIVDKRWLKLPNGDTVCPGDWVLCDNGGCVVIADDEFLRRYEPVLARAAGSARIEGQPGTPPILPTPKGDNIWPGLYLLKYRGTLRTAIVRNSPGGTRVFVLPEATSDSAAWHQVEAAWTAQALAISYGEGQSASGNTKDPSDGQ